MFSLFIIGILLSIMKIWIPIDFDGHYLKLLVLIEFMSRAALINVNYGYLLTLFYDKIFNFDTLFMWRLIDEKEVRGRLGGKLDGYRVPLMVLNSIPLPLIAYLVNF